MSATHRRVGEAAVALGLGLLVTAPGVVVAVSGIAVADSDSGYGAGAAAKHSARADPGPRSARVRAAAADRPSPPRKPLRRASADAARHGVRQVSGPVAGAARSDPLSALIDNAAPRSAAVPAGQSAGGVITGALEVSDPDGDSVAVAVTRAPQHGSVVLGSTGGYTYTANPLLAHGETVDTFDVTASDADAGFHIHGLGGLLNLLTFGLLGAAGHTSTTTVRVTVAPFNHEPTATFRQDPPDPVTGVVTGRVLGSDPNGDALTYTTSAAGQGAVIVTPDGNFTYTPGADAVAAGRDGFVVTVADGYGGSVAVPVTVTLGHSPAPALSTFCGCTLMPADTVFHADISALPVLAQSPTWTALLGGTLTARWHTTPWMGSSAGMPVNVVGPDRPAEPVVFNRGYSTSGPNIDDRPYAIPDFPLVEGMPDVPAWDRHLLVFQTGSCVSQELYNVANGVELPAAGVQDALGNAVYATLYGSTWIAEAGVHVDMNDPRYPAIGAANASKLPYLPLILRPDDLDRGEIDHMLGIAIAKDRGTGHTWPARAGDGTGTNPDGVPMGTVFRLRADFDVSGYDPSTQVVLRALQRHGAVVFDSFAAGRDGAGLLAMGNGWTTSDYPVAQHELSTIPLSAFEAVDVLSLATDPAVGWQIRT